MKWLLDAQLPRRLAQVLAAAGHDAIHTLDLPRANRTTDSEMVALAARENRIVVTKDSDFVASFHLRGVPTRLLLVSRATSPMRDCVNCSSRISAPWNKPSPVISLWNWARTHWSCIFEQGHIFTARAVHQKFSG